MSNENTITINNGKELLTVIFNISKKEKTYTPILEDTTNIPKLILFLKDKKNNIIEKAEIIYILLQLFKANDTLLPLFMKSSISKNINLYEPLIDLYLMKDENISQYKDLIEQLIKMIRNKITMNKTTIEYICQKLSVYFENKENNEYERLNEKQILKYIYLLKIFFTGVTNEKNLFEKNHFSLSVNNTQSENIKEVKNFIYFNGKRSSISLSLNLNSINPNLDYPTLQHGLSFIMWVYIDENVLKKYQEIDYNNEIKLVVINIAGEQIKLVLKDIYTFQISLNDSEVKNIQTTLIKVNDWNNICFSILEKNSTKLFMKLYVNSAGHSSFLTVSKNFPVSNKINTIKLFENFIGKVSSFMFITKGLEQKEANYYSNTKKYGFYKNKILFDFILSNDKDNEYFSNYKNYKYSEKCKSNKISFYDFHLKKQSKKNIMAIFCPFTYNKDENQIDDIFGNFIGILGENDGANYYVNNTKTIRQLGGVKNLLPIVELMYSTISKSKKIKYNLVDKSILTQSTFYEFLNLIKNIIIGHTENLNDINKSKIFSSLSLFVEKFPSHLFTPKILDILLEIGKETFQNVDKFNSRGENYISLFLLNEKIISKYNIENQLILWKNIYSFFTSDETQIKECVNIRKISLLLRLLDEKRYTEYCCKNHADIFKDDNDEGTNKEIEIMEPEMDVRLNDLFMIIQLYIDKLCEEEQSVSLFQLLSLDLSPCLQKKIIKVYVNYFENKKIDINIKSKSFDLLIKNNFIELIEYVFSISLLDVRVEILKLFRIIFDEKELKHKFQNYLGNEENGMNNFYTFVSENLLPEQLYVGANEKEINIKGEGKKEKETNKDNDLIPLSNYFNKNIYEKQATQIWNVLIKWMLNKVPPPSNISKKKEKDFNNIRNFIIDFCISFASKSPFNFIDLFIITLISHFKDEQILNREILYTNKNLYPWLIETIFYFHNSEIDYSHIYKKDYILSIQKNSINLFIEFFSHRRPHEEINKRIYYIINYSTHLIKLYGGNNNKKIIEITRITRLLLQYIMEKSSLHMNYKAKACFDFIIFHKNYNEIIGAKKSINNLNLNRQPMKDFMKQSPTIAFNSNFNTINDKTNLILKTIDEDIKDKNNDAFTSKNSNKIISTLKLDESNNLNSEENKTNLSLNKSDIIPSYIFNGLHCNINNSKEKKTENKGRNLKLIWEDFDLYDSIIDYYSSNIWSTENLRKKVKLDIDMNIMSLCKKLLKEYGENRTFRNILLKDILKCYNIKYSEEATKIEKIKINILNINVILLCLAIEITQDYDESVFLEGNFQKFIIFCVLTSININSNNPYYDLVQDNIYDVLGFAFMFLKKRDKKNYDIFIDNLIIPILNADDVKKFSFFKNKKNINKNSAIYRLFEFREKKKEDPEELDDFFNEEEINKANNLSRNTVMLPYNNIDNDIFTKNNNVYKDDSNINSKRNNNLKVVFKGESDLIMKHLFEDNLAKIKENRKYHFIFRENYKNIYNKDSYYIGNTPTNEKLRVNKIIKKLLPLYETSINNYANDEYLREKKRRNIYKASKAKIFSWRGFWSNKYLFYEHPELIKLKIKNHLTRDMIKPLLVPILDIDYNTPIFSKFDKTRLFNNNNFNYKINLDIDDILLDEMELENNLNEDNKNTINELNKEKDEFKCKKNKYGFNYLECLYRYSYKDLWDKYKKFSNQKIIFEKLILLNKEPYSILINSKKMSKNIENIQRENIYNCCIVKLTHHIKGYISTEKSRIRFIYSSDSYLKKEEIENDPNYDTDMKCCFGSIFRNMKNDKDKVVISIDYINIKYIFIRQYFYSESALEIFTDSNKSYFLNFKTNKDLIQFKSDILHHGTFREIKTEDYKGKKIVGYQQINPNSKKKTYSVTNKMEEWQNNSISTLEYLMWLNIYSGRSFNDLTQYPVFPWLITSYSDDSQELSIKSDLRNLNLPIGMMDLSEKGELRKETFIETYESIKNDLKEMFPDFNYQDYLKKGDEYLENYRNKRLKREKENQEEINTIEFNQIPYFYGSHYSNPTYVTHFLTRTFPYSYVSIEIQGEKFDDPNRIFTSMFKTFESCSTLKDDVRELIPEFYMLPEVFLNKNNLNLVQNKSDADNNLIIINDVKLPLWSNNNAINFVLKLRRYLEASYINININKWIDLIFGIAQRGEKAEENHNIFQSHTYDKNVKIDSIKDNDSKNALMRQYEMGVTPFQIFESESKNKIRNNQIITLDESRNLIVKIINSNRLLNKSKNSNDEMNKDENIKYSSLKIVKIVFVENIKIKLFTNRNKFFIMKIEEDEINSNNNSIKVEESNFFKYSNVSSIFACSYLMSDIKTPIMVFNDNSYILKGGFWDGRLELNILSTDNNKDEQKQAKIIFNQDYSPTTTMEISKNEKILLCGTKEGTLIYYKINDKNIEYKKSLYLFNDEIISISISENLNMFAVSSKEGFVNLHILPSFKLVRTINLNIKEKSNNKVDNNLVYADNIFLSNSPLACITLYIKSLRLFKSFTINGEFITEIKESDESSKLISPIVYTNNNFQDILMYGTNDGFVKMRKFPEMTLINNVKIFPGEEISAICISHDKKYCFACSKENKIAIVKDSDTNKTNNNEVIDYI